MYTAIASIGLGRPNSMSMLRWTAIGLSVAVILHSLNNGIQGLFLLILGMDGLPIYILIDISQIVLMLIGAIWLISVWRRRREVRTSCTSYEGGSDIVPEGVLGGKLFIGGPN
jgi:hypothetical protein